MTKIRKLQTNFTGGEITPDLGARTDLALYVNGASRVRNVRPLPGGGLRRRSGLASIAELEDKEYQHVEWIFNVDQTYQVLFSVAEIRIHSGLDGSHLQTIVTDWTGDMIGVLSTYAQGDFMFIAHPDRHTRQLKRTGASTFVLENYVFDRLVSGAERPIFQPYFRYQRPDVTIKVVSLGPGYSEPRGWEPGGTATITTPIDVFVPDHVGTYLQISRAQWEITGFTDARTVTGALRSSSYRIHLTENPITFTEGLFDGIAYDPSHTFIVGDHVIMANFVPFASAAYQSTNGLKTISAVTDSTWTFPLGGPASVSAVGGGVDGQYWSAFSQTTDWQEQMYSPVHGYPHCVGGFQSRLVLAGGRDAPNRLNHSRVEAPFNFDPGDGLDNEAILVGISGRRTPTVRSVVGSDHLQVFTSEGEYYVPRSDITQALTPSTMAVLPQTFYGTKEGVPAIEFDGATLFVSRNGGRLRQLVWAEKGYVAQDLSYVADHLLTNPTWLAVQMEDANNGSATALVVNSGGSIAALTMVRSEKVAAWSRYDTEGEFRTACVVDTRVFTVVRRTINGVTKRWLEQFDKDRLLDASVMGTYVGRDGQYYVWEGFDHLVGQEINLVVDGLADIGLHTPDALGRIRTLSRATTLEGGLGFTPLVRTLNPEVGLPDGPSPGEMRRVVMANVELVGAIGTTVNGQKIWQTLAQDDLGLPAQPYTGKVDVWLFGWDDEGQVTVSQSVNAPFTLLSANLQLEF